MPTQRIQHIRDQLEQTRKELKTLRKAFEEFEGATYRAAQLAVRYREQRNFWKTRAAEIQAELDKINGNHQ